MRYDTPVYFQLVKKGEYDITTGNYGEPTVTEVKKYASVTDTGTETLKLIYGDIKQRSLTIRLQQPYNLPFNRICIGGKHYKPDMERRHRNSHIFVVSEVQGNG
jgi:hypothetical protein